MDRARKPLTLVMSPELPARSGLVSTGSPTMPREGLPATRSAGWVYAHRGQLTRSPALRRRATPLLFRDCPVAHVSGLLTDLLTMDRIVVDDSERIGLSDREVEHG